LDYLCRLLFNLFVGIYVARFLGPDRSGLFLYLTSLAAVFSAVAKLGMDGVMVREMVRRPDEIPEEMGTAFWLIAGAGSVSLAVLGLCVLAGERDASHVLFALLAGSVAVFQAFNVIDWYFQSKLQTRYVVLCRVASLSLSSMLKLGGILASAPLGYFFWVCLAEQVLLALIYLTIWISLRLPPFLSRFCAARARELIGKCWPLIFAALALTVYTKIDQIMIRLMLGNQQAGIYGAALRIYEAWIAIPTLLSVSVLPAIVSSREKGAEVYHRRMVLLTRGLFFSSLLAAVVVGLNAERLVLVSFGPAFRQSALVLPLIMFGTAWAALGSCTMRYLIVENMEAKIAVRCIAGAVINAGLNLYFIPRFGARGPAIALILSAFATNYLIDWFDPDLRPLLRIKHQAMLFSW